jgi:hypothetical protein
MKWKSFNGLGLLAAGICGSAILISTGGVKASYVGLTGGDPSGGLTLNPSNVVDALYTPVHNTGPGTAALTTTSGTQQVWQGVTFTPTNSNMSRSSGTYLLYSSEDTGTNSGNAGFTDTSNTTQDTNLLDLVNAGLDYKSATVTVNGLSPNSTYQVDSIISLIGYGAGGRTDAVAYNGGTPTASDTITFNNTNYIYAVQDMVASTASGTITIDYSGSQGPFYSAIVVSSVPDPTTIGLLGVGTMGLLLLLKKRRHLA